MAIYLNRVKCLYDSLATSLKRPIDEVEIINTASDGLGQEYAAFVDSLHVREQTTFTQFYRLQQECNLKKRNEVLAGDHNVSAFVGHLRGQSGGCRQG